MIKLKRLIKNKKYSTNKKVYDKVVEYEGRTYITDQTTNINTNFVEKTTVDLLNKKDHPLLIIKENLKKIFNKFETFEDFSCVTSTKKAFDDLLITDPKVRTNKENYYINKHNLFKPHATCNELDVFDTYKKVKNFVIFTKCFRKDKIDKTHNNIFHQFEVVKLFENKDLLNCSVKNNKIKIENIQDLHIDRISKVENVVSDLKETIDKMLGLLFRNKKIEVRWLEDKFPFTKPSFEVEIKHNNKWLEICGCGLLRQEILDSYGHKDKLGWACGFGLERLAMILYDIKDIRWFWTKDERFVNFFKDWESKSLAEMQFVPFSKYPACFKDVSFYVGGSGFDYLEMCDVVRNVGGDLIENVELIDEFKNNGNHSMCYRITYRSMTR